MKVPTDRRRSRSYAGRTPDVPLADGHLANHALTEPGDADAM